MATDITITLSVEDAELIASLLAQHTEYLSEGYGSGDLNEEQFEALNVQTQHLLLQFDEAIEDATAEDEEDGE